jgi:hypothetical protein
MWDQLLEMLSPKDAAPEAPPAGPEKALPHEAAVEKNRKYIDGRMGREAYDEEI